MLNCEAYENLMVDALYDGLENSDGQRLQAHLQNCSECQARWQQLSGDIDVLQRAGLTRPSLDDIPERADLELLWDRLQPELDAIDQQRQQQRPGRQWLPYVSGALAMAASLVLFLFVFDLSIETGAPEQQVAQQTPVPAQAISPALMEYLTKAETMLLLVANAESDNVSVVPIRQTTARQMAQEASYLTTGIDDSISSGQARLLKDIEFMLMQIANLDESNMADGVRLLQQYIEDNSVFFKIRLLEVRNQNQLLQPAPANEVIL